MGEKGLQVITAEDTEEIVESKKEQAEDDIEINRRRILRLCMNKDFRWLMVDELKKVMLSPESELSINTECTAYNLGKSDAYKERLLKIRDAAEIANSDEEEAITEILQEWFFSN